MPRQIRPDLTLDGLKKEAKGWLKAIRANDATARARFMRALPDASPAPTLRDVQLALAREFGLDGWTTETDFVGSHDGHRNGRPVAGRGGIALPRQCLPRPLGLEGLGAALLLVLHPRASTFGH